MGTLQIHDFLQLRVLRLDRCMLASGFWPAALGLSALRELDLLSRYVTHTCLAWVLQYLRLISRQEVDVLSRYLATNVWFGALQLMRLGGPYYAGPAASTST